MGLREFISHKFKGGGKEQLLENFVSLSFLQLANFLLPLITFPYLVRVLGAEKFGLVMFAFAFNQYFIILTDFGFNLSATKEISVNRDDPKKLNRIFSSVMIIKTGFLLFGFLILYFLTSYFDKFKEDQLLYLFSYGVAVGQAYFPVWFFQGMEKMKFVTILNVTAKSVFAISLFVIVKQPEDFIFVPIVNSLGFLVAAVISLYLIRFKFKIKFFIPKVSDLIFQLKESSHFFASRAAVSFYTNSNTFIIGLVLGNVAAGFYSAAEKLFMAMNALYTPLTDSLYPYMAKRKDIKTFKKIFKIASLANLMVCLFVFLFASQIISIIYGQGFDISARLLEIFAILACIIVPSTLLGYPLLAALGHPKFANYSVIIAALFHISLLTALVPILSLKLVVILLIITQLIVIGIRIYGVKTKLKNIW